MLLDPSGQLLRLGVLAPLELIADRIQQTIGSVTVIARFDNVVESWLQESSHPWDWAISRAYSPGRAGRRGRTAILAGEDVVAVGCRWWHL
jgi:hypothetical protein